MTINGQDCSDKGTIAESFNIFFVSIGKQNELNIRTHQGSYFRDYLTGASNCNYAFHLTDNTTTLRIIKNTKSSTSNGHDGICSEFLKLITVDVSKCITTIINQSLTSGTFPNSLKSLELLDRVLDQMDKHKIPTNFYIDLSKAFDSLRHDILLDKLTYYSVTNPAKKLMESYLSNCIQFVQIGNKVFIMKPVLT